MRIDVITLFPGMFEGVLGESILKRAASPVADPAARDDPARVRPPVVDYHVHQLRDYTDDKHGKVDDSPFGGGPGMVLSCDPVWDAVHAVEAMDDRSAVRVVPTPKGQPLTQPLVEKLSEAPRLLILSGHYEGFDQRVLDALDAEREVIEVSLGDYVLSGGELPAMVLIDAVVRLLPGVLGDAESAKQDSFSSEHRLLDHPHYTRPRVWRGVEAPDVLLSGDHGKIAKWRADEARRMTQERRPDLLGLGDAGGGGTSALVTIRAETAADRRPIDRMLRDTFETGDEAEVVYDLREAGELLASLVATQAGEVVGHAALFEMTLTGQTAVRGLYGLGPVAVTPSHQGRGIGSELVRAALAQAKHLGAKAVIVLGDPAYYARFGFEPVGERFTSIFGSSPALQMHTLRPLPEHVAGPIDYPAAFDRFAESPEAP